MLKVRPEFEDGRVCGLCGWPAARLIRERRDFAGGVECRAYEPYQVFVETHEHDPHAEKATFFRDKTTTTSGVTMTKQEPVIKWGRHLTHECARFQALAEPTDPDDPRTYPSCGMLTYAQTKKADTLPPWCYYDASGEVVPTAPAKEKKERGMKALGEAMEGLL